MINTKLPILLTDGFYLFPKCQRNLSLENNQNWKEIILLSWKQYQGKLLIFSTKEKSENVNLVQSPDEFYSVGTLAKINLFLIKEKSNNFNGESAEFVINSLKEIQLEGLERVQLFQPRKENQFWKSDYEILVEEKVNQNEEKINKLTERFIRYLPDILKETNLNFTEKLPYLAMGNLGTFLDFIAQNSNKIERETKQLILASLDPQKRLELFLNLLKKAENEQQMKKDTEKQIEDKVKGKFRDQQKIFYLRQKQKEIADELRNLEGAEDETDEIQQYLQRLDNEFFPDYVKETVKKEIKKYEEIPISSAEANMVRNYIDCIMSLQWNFKEIPEIKNLDSIIQALNKKHFGLEKPKKIIVEHFAVSLHTNKVSGQVLCFIGPPGVGKTSLAASIAQATGRKMIRISLGGVRDAAKIKGHRRTYVGAMVGEIIKAMDNKLVYPPLVLLDEVDKISQDYFRSDPASALLELLDPEQNTNFTDDYLAMPYDLSKVLFICTANSTESIPRPLLDRMKLVFLSSYTALEKLQIAEKYLIVKILSDFKLSKEQINFQSEAIEKIIQHYTYESGVRELKRKLQEIASKFIVEIIQEKKQILIVTSKNLFQYLGKPIYDFTTRKINKKSGVVNGLAYTKVGGDILPIEVSYSSGKGNLILTGRLGEVMKESAQVALSYVKVNCQNFQIDPELFAKNDIYIHAPEGAVPKEGPSAGTALTTAIISALTGLPVSPYIGMTGEITLKGDILAIGGLREKSIAAQRSGLKTIFIPKKNVNDVEEDIPEEIKKKLEIVLVEEYQDLWAKILIKNKNIKKKILPIVSLHKSAEIPN